MSSIFDKMNFKLRSGGRKSGGQALFICPICEAPAFIRSSAPMTPTIKHFYVHCTNTGCGHTWLAQTSFIHTLSPSAIERTDLNLPICPAHLRPMIYPPEAKEHEDKDQIPMFPDTERIAA